MTTPEKIKQRLAELKSGQPVTKRAVPEVAMKGVLNKTIVANTYNYVDLHGHVMMPGAYDANFTESVPLVHDHYKDRAAVIGKINKLYNGEYTDKGGQKLSALMADVDVMEKLNPNLYEQYKQDMVQQHSVSAYLTDYRLAASPELLEDKEANGLYDSIMPVLINPERAKENGFFMVIDKAKIIEISAVLHGSNEKTPTLSDKKADKDKFITRFSKPQHNAIIRISG